MCCLGVILVVNYCLVLTTTTYVLPQSVVQIHSLPVVTHYIGLPSQPLGLMNQYNGIHNTNNNGYTIRSATENEYYDQNDLETIGQKQSEWGYLPQNVQRTVNRNKNKNLVGRYKLVRIPEEEGIVSSFIPQNGQNDIKPNDLTNPDNKMHGDTENTLPLKDSSTKDKQMENRINTLEKKLEDLRDKASTKKPDKDKFELASREADDLLNELKLLEISSLPSYLLIRVKLLVEKVKNIKEEIVSKTKITLINPLVDQINELIEQLENIQLPVLLRTDQYKVKDVREKLKDLKIKLLSSSDPNILNIIQPQLKTVISELDGIKCLSLSSKLKLTISKFGSFLGGIVGFIVGVPRLLLG